MKPVRCPYPETFTLRAWALQLADETLRHADERNHVSYDSARAALREKAKIELALAEQARGKP